MGQESVIPDLCPIVIGNIWSGPAMGGNSRPRRDRGRQYPVWTVQWWTQSSFGRVRTVIILPGWNAAGCIRSGPGRSRQQPFWTREGSTAFGLIWLEVENIRPGLKSGRSPISGVVINIRISGLGFLCPGLIGGGQKCAVLVADNRYSGWGVAGSTWPD